MKDKLIKLYNVGLFILISLDLIFLTSSLVFNLPTHAYYNLVIFDTCLCVILLYEFFNRFFKADDKREFFISNWTEFIAGIPFDLLMFSAVGYVELTTVLKVFKFIRILILFLQLFEVIRVFLRHTYLDEILSIFLMIIISFTFGLYLFDPSMNSLFDSLWFVVSTLTTVGYGDVLPTSTIGKVISLILLIGGVLIFSTITAAMASYFNKRLLNEGADELKSIQQKLDSNVEELKELRREIADLNRKLDEK
ncbi:MAG: ion channel [Methanobrevibacter sp.]|nr:ion channel [Methanobrevibacter sp.]